MVSKTCRRAYAPYEIKIKYHVGAGDCITIQISDLFFPIKGTIYLYLDSKISQGNILHFYQVVGLASLDSNNYIKVFARRKGTRTERIAHLRGRKAEAHWNYSVVHFDKKEFNEVHSLSFPTGVFARSIATVQVSHEQLSLNESKGQEIFQKMRSFALVAPTKISLLPTTISVPVERFLTNILQISAQVHPRFVDNPGIFVIQSSHEVMMPGQHCDLDRGHIVARNLIGYRVSVNLSYFLSRNKLVISTPGDHGAIVIQVHAFYRLSSVTFHSGNPVVGVVPLVKRGRRELRDWKPAKYRISSTLRGHAENTKDGDFTLFRSGSTLLSWLEGQMICKYIQQALVEFSTPAKLTEFLLMAKKTKDIPPLLALFIGIRRKVGTL